MKPGAERAFLALCGATVALALLLQAAGVLRRNVHWDEFIFLSNVHTWLRGGPLRLFQTPYVHLFGWLPAAGADELAQVRLGRWVLLASWTASLALLYRLALRVGDRTAAAAAVAVAAALTENLVHASSFRVDGLMAPVFLGACLAATVPSSRRSALAGALGGVLLALSLKASLLLPLLVAVALASARGRSDARRLLATGATSFAATAAAIFAVHGALLPDAPAAIGTPATTWAFLRNAGTRMLLEGGLFPRAGTLQTSALANLPAWLLVAVGLGTAGGLLRQGEDRARAWLLLLFATPVALFAVYRNLWPYAFVSLLPTVWVVAGVGWARALRSPLRGARLGAWAAFAWVLGAQLVTAGGLRRDGTELQRQTLDVVHGLFPEPVPYIDRVGMVAGFPRPLFNMTTFGLETYRARGVPELSRYIEALHPPLLILNTSTLAVFGDPAEAGADPRPPLLPEDEARVRESYAHFWGPVYLAGQRWDRLDAGQEVAFPIHVPGRFTLLAPGPLTVDGVALAPGESVELAVGTHTVVSPEAQADVRLLWGRNLVEPTFAPAPGPVFRGF
ncbi:MAG: hypothetical protein Q8N53_10525 [Longimicrobiales bacterium]|nr:hypothetical protein [Longimicrobiales bacterium]